MKGKYILLPVAAVAQDSLWIGPDKIDPTTKCIFDNIDAIIITDKTWIYIFKFFFLSLRRKDKGISKIKGKKSCISELFKPIINKKK